MATRFGDLKNIFCIGKKKEEDKELDSYAIMLGLNRDFKFPLGKNKVTNEVEFNKVCEKAEEIIVSDFIRFGLISEEAEEEDYKIRPAKVRKTIGVVASMTILADNSGNITTKFHRRDSYGYWDGETKRYPEKETTGEYKHEVFYELDDEWEEDEE